MASVSSGVMSSAKRYIVWRHVAECLAGVTREGARARGILGETGTLEAGKWCDLAIWDIDRPAELIYRMGFNPLHRRVWRGQ